MTVVAVLAVVACGSRTGLPLFTEEAVGDDGGPSPDAGRDVVHLDAPFESALDVTKIDAMTDCPDVGSTLVYVITESYDLLSFDPRSLEFRTIGAIRCPTPDPAATPFSMAVDKKGIAYIVFTNATCSAGGQPDPACPGNGLLYRVSTATAACTPTPFRAGQSGFVTFGMGFSADPNGMTETLYVASDALQAPSRAPALATIDIPSFNLNVVGDFNPAIDGAELTGTGGGDLFAFYAPAPMATDSFIAQLDKNTAQVTGMQLLSGLTQGSGWAFAFYGGDFYTFTAPGAETVVTRYSPSDGSLTQVATYPEIIVGAGVSTCAPQQ